MNIWKPAGYYGKKLLLFFASILLLSAAVFFISRLAPGDPLVSYYGDRAEKMSPAQREWAGRRLGLDQPLAVQYACWLRNALHGDFGISYKYKMDVTDVIAGRTGNTLVLGGAAFVLTAVPALLLGLLCAWKEGSLTDRVICRAGPVFGCIPEFWLSLILILIFAVRLPWFPSSGAYTIGREQDAGDRIWHLVLPVTVLVLGHLWYYAYLVRNLILDEIRSDYVLLAKSKGLGRRSILLRHCLRNAAPAYVSMLALAVPHMLGGTYIVEMVFSYPGLGTLSYESARYQDYNLLMLLCILTGTAVILCSMAAQIINEKTDGRI